MDVTAINDPRVVAEVAEAFEAYERALLDDDLPRLAHAFWDSESTVRYGLGEQLYGRTAIDAWRDGAAGVPTDRMLGPTVIATFGADTACVSTEFRDGASTVVGRQTQTWVRLGRWQIVAAHVSRGTP